MDPQRVLGALGGNAKGHFASGSMGPKVDAALRFAENGGRQAGSRRWTGCARASRAPPGRRVRAWPSA